MNPLTNKPATLTDAGNTIRSATTEVLINVLTSVLVKLGLLREDADYHLLRASMVIMFFFFGYQKWFAYEVDRLIPFISNGPLIFWLYPALGMRGATLFLGISEWTFGTLMFLGFWNKAAGHSRGARFNRHLHSHCHDYSFHARGLGRSRRRLSCDDRQCSVSGEGCRALGGVGLSAETGRPAGGTCHRHQ
jgi:hypothetical protein